jgi:hypothetical protein
MRRSPGVLTARHAPRERAKTSVGGHKRSVRDREREGVGSGGDVPYRADSISCCKVDRLVGLVPTRGRALRVRLQ